MAPGVIDLLGAGNDVTNDNVTADDVCSQFSETRHRRRSFGEPAPLSGYKQMTTFELEQMKRDEEERPQDCTPAFLIILPSAL